MLKPMLAKDFLERYLRKFYSVYEQPKLDGQRAVWDGYELWSRGGKKIVSVPGVIKELTTHFQGFPLDGELYCHGMSFQKIRKCVGRKKNIQDNDKILYHIYDKPVEELIFEDRWALLDAQKELFAQCPRLSLVPTNLLTVTSYCIKDLDTFLKDGYEGTMLRNSAGLYKFAKRSSDLLKVKQFIDEEFVVVGLTEAVSYEKLIVLEGTSGSKRYSDGRCYKDVNPTPQGVMGALICKASNGLEFEVGSGYDDAERIEFWQNPPIGQKITVKYQELSDTGVPRFGIYKCLYEPL